MINVRINNIELSDEKPTFITFEIGPTHNGVESAKRLIKHSVDSGANAVKFQIFDPDKLVADKKQLFSYEILIDKKTGEKKTVEEPLYDILKRRCLNIEEWKEIKDYCEAYRINHVSKDHAIKLFGILGVLPQGLNRIEWQILNILKKHGSCSLASIAAKTGLSRSSIQRDHEMFLLRKGFITIEGLRKITYDGVKVVEKKFN